MVCGKKQVKECLPGFERLEENTHFGLWELFDNFIEWEESETLILK